MIDLDLSGKRALVTGASLGIGEAVVKLLADHGADVSFCARTESGRTALKLLQAGLAMNRIFEVLGENKKYIEFYHTARAAAAHARGPCNMARQLEAT